MPLAGFRRRRLLIDRRSQLRSAVVAGVSVVAYSVILGVLIFYPLQRSLLQDASPEAQLRAADQIMELHRRVWPAVIAVAVLVGFQSVISTHRMLGPVYRLKIAFAALQNGDLAHRVHLRKHDQFQDLAESFNRLAAELERAEAARSREHADPRELVTAAAESRGSPSPARPRSGRA